MMIKKKANENSSDPKISDKNSSSPSQLKPSDKPSTPPSAQNSPSPSPEPNTKSNKSDFNPLKPILKHRPSPSETKQNNSINLEESKIKQNEIPEDKAK